MPAFGPMVALGFLLGTWILARLARRYEPEAEHDPEPWAELPVWVLIGILTGARMLYVIVELARGSATGQSYLDNPLTIFAFWQGGLVMYGGLFGGILGGALCVRRRKLSFWHALDIALTSGFFGLTIGRIGCLLVGDDFGRIVPKAHESWPFPLVLQVPSPLPDGSLFGSANTGQFLYATQPWMSINAFFIGLLGLWLLKRRSFHGQVSLILLVWYALTRSFIENFRGDDIRGTWFDGSLSTSQLISIAAGLTALVIFAMRSKSSSRTA